MKLEEIGFYTLSNNRCKNASINSPFWRAEISKGITLTLLPPPAWGREIQILRLRRRRKGNNMFDFILGLFFIFALMSFVGLLTGLGIGKIHNWVKKFEKPKPNK